MPKPKVLVGKGSVTRGIAVMARGDGAPDLDVVLLASQLLVGDVSLCQIFDQASSTQ